jgi:hypothetical protein
MRNILTAGELSYSVAAVLMALAFYIGLEVTQLSAKPPAKVAFAEKSAVILESVFSRKDISASVLDEQIKKPIMAVIKRYVDQGYVVIDSGRDENGNMTVTGIPSGAIDITPDIKAAINAASTLRTTPAQPSGNTSKQ